MIGSSQVWLGNREAVLVSRRTSHLVSRTLLRAGVAAGVVGLALLWSRRRVSTGGPAASRDVRPVADQATGGKPSVPQLYQLAGDEAVVYLRGYMDGRRDEAA